LLCIDEVEKYNWAEQTSYGHDRFRLFGWRW